MSIAATSGTGGQMGCPLEATRHDPAFQAQSCQLLLLSSDFIIKAVSGAYVASSGRSEDELLEANVFDVFPRNPALPHGACTGYFVEAVERVQRFRRREHLAPLRYDVRPASTDGFTQKQWALAISPVCVDDRVRGVMVRVQDITDLLAGKRVDTRALPELVESYRALASETVHLRRALRTRPTIDMAKGIVMAERHCSADEAFEVLRRLSMDTNVPVAEVAGAIVYQAHQH